MRAKIVAARSEEEIYAALGLPFIEPELREGRGEIERALRGDFLPLVTDRDLRGILHAHTDLSDGVDTLEVMAQATRERGYQYFGVADHSKSAHLRGWAVDRRSQSAAPRHRPAEPLVQQGLPHSQRHRVRYPGRRFTGLSRRCAGTVRLRRGERAQPFQARSQDPDGPHHPRGRKSEHNHPRPYDRPPAVAAAGLRSGY